MAEFTGEATVEYDGEYELDVDKLSDEKIEELFLALLDRHLLLQINLYRENKVTIPITIEFDTEVTIDVDPPDRY